MYHSTFFNAAVAPPAPPAPTHPTFFRTTIATAATASSDSTHPSSDFTSSSDPHPYRPTGLTSTSNPHSYRSHPQPHAHPHPHPHPHPPHHYHPHHHRHPAARPKPPAPSATTAVVALAPPPQPAPTSYVGSMSKDCFVDQISLNLDFRANRNADRVPLPTYAQPESVFFSVSRPEIPTRDYVRRLVTYTQCSPSAFVVMMLYLDRIAVSNPRLAVTPYNMHRLLVTALTLACKMLDDRCFSNVHYAKVGGIPTAREMNRLELQFLSYLNYRLHVSEEEYRYKHLSLESQPLPLESQPLPTSPTSPTSLLDATTAFPSPPPHRKQKDDLRSIISADSGVSVTFHTHSSEPSTTTTNSSHHSHPSHYPAMQGHTALEKRHDNRPVPPKHRHDMRLQSQHDPHLTALAPQQQLRRINEMVP